MNNYDLGYDIGVISIVTIIIVIIIIFIIMFKIGYRSGQIDAISGADIQYELVTNPDKSVTWKHIKRK